jgi:hypothetical protein
MGGERREREDESAVGARRVRAVDLDQVDRVVGLGRPVRVRARARLRVAVDRDGLREGRIIGGGLDRVDAGARDVEGDRVGAGGRVRVEDDLAQRPCAAVVVFVTVNVAAQRGPDNKLARIKQARMRMTRPSFSVGRSR